MNVKQANLITGGLSNPSKMPGRAYNISAYDCKRGSELAKIAGTVCASCYARKGRYSFPNVQNALNKRKQAFGHPEFISAMVYLIKKQSPRYFRWFDSGDLQDTKMLGTICAIACLTPDTKHWLPTKERNIVLNYAYKEQGHIPDNLIIRISAPYINEHVDTWLWAHYSEVHTKDKENTKEQVYYCPAHLQGNKCGDCRVCWSANIPIVSYLKH